MEPMRWFDETGRVRYQPKLSTGERLWLFYLPFGSKRVWATVPDNDLIKYLTRTTRKARQIAAKEERRRARLFRHPEAR